MYTRLTGLSLFKFAPTHQATPLHCAVAGGHVDTVRYLVGAGGDIHSKDGEGVSE